MPSAAEVKKALREAGLEIYRTRGDVVHLAERVRENLLMDAQIFVRAGDPSTTSVGFVVRAQRNDFPNDGEEHLFARARLLGASAIEHGYHEVEAVVRRILDPGDGERTLDTWCEVQFEKPVANLDAAVVEARFALSIEKAAPPTVDGVPPGSPPGAR
jgi:hypothetical protein